MAYHDQWIAMTSDGKLLKESRDELLTVPSLLNTLAKISNATASDTKFCFFLDGLDEYDGRSADIIKLVDILKSFSNVKTCVSGRSWNDFEDRFGDNFPWKPYIHDFTREDIRLFVGDTLGKHPRFQQLQKVDPQCPNFVHNIVRDADGVFLWVFLVTQSLLDGLTNSDRIKDLQERVNETPKDLKDYFNTILFSTENRYRTQTARILTVAVNAEKELPLMAYWVIDQEDPKYCFRCSAKTPANEDIDSRVEHMRRRLKLLSKGLLEASHLDAKNRAAGSIDSLLFGLRVGFLHRTVKDYLHSPDAQSLLRSWLNSTFDVDWEICSAFGALTKMATPELFNPSMSQWKNEYIYLLNHVLRLDENLSFRRDLATLLEHLQDLLTPVFEQHKDVIYQEATRNGKDGSFLKGEHLEPDIVIVSACACLGMMNFVTEKFTNEPQLCYRVTSHVSSLFWTMFFINYNVQFTGLPMLKFLLGHGADPNSGLNGKSEWRLLMELFDSAGADLISSSSKNFEGIKLLLQYGANFEEQCERQNIKDAKTTSSEMLKEWFGDDQFAVLADIVNGRASKNKKSSKLRKKIRRLQLWISS